MDLLLSVSHWANFTSCASSRTAVISFQGQNLVLNAKFAQTLRVHIMFSTAVNPMIKENIQFTLGSYIDFVDYSKLHIQSS